MYLVFYSPLACDAPVYRKKTYKVPKSREYLKEVLALPMHEKMNLFQVNFVIKNILSREILLIIPIGEKSV